MAVENFGDTPEEFDFDSWLDQGGRAQRTVTVYSNWTLMDELARLEKAIETAEQNEDPSLDEVGAEELREQYEGVLAELEASGKQFTLRALTNEEVRTVTAGVPDIEHKFKDQHGKEQVRWKPDQIANGDALVAEALVSPKLTRDQVRAMRVKLGDGPTLVLYQTVGELRDAGQEMPSVPTSPGRSDDSRA